MRTDGGADDVVGVGRMAAPVANRLVGGIFQCHVTRGNRHHRGSHHFHLLHVHLLPFHIGLTHIDSAGHLHQGTDGGGSHAVLPGTGLCDDPCLAHLASDQDLSDGVVNLVRTGMIEVLTFQVDLRPVTFRQLAGVVERRRASHVIAQQLIEILPETIALHDPQIGFTQISHAPVKDFGDIGTPELTIVPILIDVELLHNLMMFISLIRIPYF